MRRSIQAAAIAAIVVAAGITAPQALAATSPGVSSDGGVLSGFAAQVGPAFIANQDSLDQLKTWILNDPAAASSGYIDQINDSTHLAVTLLWHGTDAFQSTVAAHARSLGIAVTVQQRSLSLPQIQAAEQKITASSGALQAAGFSVSTVVGVRADSSAIEVDGVSISPASSSGVKAQALAVGASATALDSVRVASTLTAKKASLDDALSQIAGTTVQTVLEGAAAAPQYTRSTDYSPFYAGGFMGSTKGTSTSACSSGFAIRYNGVNRTTTARHCTPPSGSWHAWDNSSSSYGSFIASTATSGVAELSGAGNGRMMDGAWNSTNTSKAVQGYLDVGLNDLICTSGGNSGTHCNIKITATSVSWNDGSGAIMMMRGTQQTAGAMASANGDSGGAVLTLKGTDGTKVNAVGMIQTGDTNVTCPSIHWTAGGSVACTSQTYFSSTHTLLSELGASIVTG